MIGQTKNKNQRWFGRVGRFALSVIVALVLVTLMLLLASVLFEHDPDGHQVRDWLTAGRYWLFAWRLLIYTALGWLWFRVVRAQVVKTSLGGSLRRLEWMTAAFILVTEIATWRSALA